MRSLRLIWSSRELARIACEVSTVVAAIIGWLVLSAALGLWFASGVGMGEPFRDVIHYSLWFVWFVVVGTALAAVVTAFPWAGVLLTLRHAARNWPPQRRAQSHVFLLGHLVLLLPIALWAWAAALAYSSAGNFEFYGPAGKPPWVHWQVWTLLSSPYWLAPAAIAYVAVCWSALGVVRDMKMDAQVPTCAKCGYILIGLPQPRCPECATPFTDATRHIGAGDL